ncbi:GDSL-type esterase/lipase family protein [Aureimonas leprariae]|uniref:SGNH hydrolase-type esterase domain-containing protein n=1 Tax=Plantimonas leprariae TaxID=2615207 RepID=A0A7V7TWX6_9HYPH|nr:GDSL-type esterase/lipase family protein [Aureimonas leprariae]KAB0680295.1 hypothetical protein F6X38_08950 [Aureimonas leprariae]
MSGLLNGYPTVRGGTRRLAIALTALVVGENAAPGTEVGQLTGPAEGWSYHLVDNAGDMFALDGRRLVVGATPLNYATTPFPKLLVAATDGKRAAADLLAVSVRRALPELPFAAGARVAAIGDSQIGYNNTFGAKVSEANKAAYSTAYGFIEQAQSLDQRFRFDNWFDPADPRGLNYAGANQGLHGDHMEWLSQPQYLGGMTARLPAVLARRPDILIIEGGLNTLHSGDDTDGKPLPASYVIAKLDRMLVDARAAGVWTILVAVYPTGLWPAGDSRHAELAKLAEWCRAQAGREGVIGVLDAADLLAPAGVLDAAMFKADKTHLSVRGALAVARQKLLPLLQTAIRPGSTFDQDPGRANLLAASVANMAGTGGTTGGGLSANGETRSGQVATGLTLTIGRNCSFVASKNTIAGPSEEQVIAITPGGTSAGAYAELTLSGMVAMEAADPNQWYQAFLEVETGGDGLGFASLIARQQQGATIVTQTQALQRESSADFALGDGGGARSFWLQTEPFRSADAYDRIDIRLLLTFSKTTAPFTVRVRKPIVRRVADPRPAWGY